MTGQTDKKASDGSPLIGVRVANGDPLRQWLTDRQQRMMAPGLATQLRAEAVMLRDLLAAELRRQRWTLAELGLLADVMNGDILTSSVYTGGVSMITANLVDATSGLEAEYEAQHGVHPARVVEKLQTLGPAADAALRDALSRWWATQDEGPDAHTVEGWARVGVRVVEG
ncbi:MAG TPA: hypothetical protein VFP72_18345 [Kineosporiaceae bacterium]|nr:hypothetical protein [Kineosporiaceae bacterium]